MRRVDTKRADNPRLSRAPLVEAVLELHFNKVADYLAYGPIPGQMFERLRSVYPRAVDLDAASFPLALETPTPFVRHRFSSEDGKTLFQVGNGIVTSNSVGYETYPVFRRQAEPVAKEGIALFGGPLRVALRYINKIPTRGIALDGVLLVGLNVPAGSTWIRQQASCARSVGVLGEFQMTWAIPVDDQADLLLFDLQITSETFDADATSDTVLAWMDAAHGEIEGEFLGNLDPGFLESLK